MRQAGSLSLGLSRKEAASALTWARKGAFAGLGPNEKQLPKH